MHSDRVKVLHTAHCNYITGIVAHGFKLDFLPAENIFLYKYLCYRRRVKSGFGDYFKLVLAVSDAAAGAAQGKRRTDYYRIPDFRRNLKRGVDIIRYIGRYCRLAYFRHCILKKLPVLRLVYRLGVSAYKPHAVFAQETVLVKLHCYGKTGLTAKPCKQTVRLFL